MKELVGLNMIFFAITFLVTLTVGENLEIKDKALILAIELITMGLLSVGLVLMTEG